MVHVGLRVKTICYDILKHTGNSLLYSTIMNSSLYSTKNNMYSPPPRLLHLSHLRPIPGALGLRRRTGLEAMEGLRGFRISGAKA